MLLCDVSHHGEGMRLRLKIHFLTEYPRAEYHLRPGVNICGLKYQPQILFPLQDPQDGGIQLVHGNAAILNGFQHCRILDGIL